MATTKKPVNKLRKQKKNVGFWQSAWGSFTAWTVRVHFFKRLLLGFLALLILCISSMYGIAKWYMHAHKNEPLEIGATFVPDYARYFGLDAKKTYTAILDDLGVKTVRLVSYWDNIEREQGTYNFDELDWQFRMAEERGVKVSLALGLRQPRWPECHMPTWAEKMPANTWYEPLYKFIGSVVERYETSPALESYQLENEFFLSVFGICPDFNRDRLVHEYDLIKSLDPNHRLIVSMSNNAIGTPIGEPTPDQWAISVYKRVWDKTITRRYFEYPIPAWYYAFRAGFTEITRGRDSFIHELQTEPWIADPVGGIQDATIEEQDKTLDATKLKHRIQYGVATGMRKMDMWGAEFWYWRMVKHNDPSLWNTAKEKVAEANAGNEKLKAEGKLKIITDIIKE